MFPSGETDERRGLRRFGLELAARIWPRGAYREPLDLLTSDVSAGGAFFETGAPLCRGARVWIEMVVPLSRGTTTIQVSGTVVRSGDGGMAVRFDEDFELAGGE